jgi:aspartyl-tRNA(Asn)/glutamyl-tRNA(Gln) amidotransferase subunit A
MAAGIEAALGTLAGLGADVREIETAPLGEFLACNRTIMTSEAFAIHEKWMRERPEDYGALARERIMAGAFVRAADYVNATRLRRKMADAFHALFAGMDVAVTASSMDPACRIDDPAAVEITYPRQARTPFNVTGHPALTLMCGLSQAEGLPLSLQLVGRFFDEATLYRAAAGYERAAPWKDRRPAP